MPVYEYTSLDQAGKPQKGIIDADSTLAARQKIRGRGQFPVEVRETIIKPKESESRGLDLSFIDFFTRVKNEEVHALTRQLSTLLGAGIPLVGALDSLIHQASGATLKRIVSQIKEAVNEGNSLTSALASHPKVFSKIYINMVRAGEASGSLDVVLDRLAEFGERQDALRGRFKAALIYPLFMCLVGAAVLFFLVTFIVPNITRIFDEMHQALPMPTLILIGLSGFLKSFWWAVLLGLAGLIGLIRELIRRPKGHYVWDNLKLKLPVLGPINRKTAMARFARTMGSLLESGVPLLTSLEIVRNIVNNLQMAEILDGAQEEIKMGKSLNLSFTRKHWFPPMVIQMITVGEQSGELEKMLHKIADTYERDVESSIMGLTALIEPVMILAMGLVVLFIVLAILLPIFDLNQMIT